MHQQKLVNSNKCNSIAIIGGGLASASLCLSLAERGIATDLFCKDKFSADGASGNKQGVLYPLLTPENNLLSQFFQQGFIYTKARIHKLTSLNYDIAFDFCGVIQTASSLKKQQYLNKIIASSKYSSDLIQKVSAKQANDIAGIAINNPDTINYLSNTLSSEEQAIAYYPTAGWVCPKDLTQASLEYAANLVNLNQFYQCKILSISQKHSAWYLHSDAKTFGPYEKLIIANGWQINQFEQTKQLPLTPYRGQVSHIPTTKTLNKLKTVLCSEGYFTPAYNNCHSMGASYIKLTPYPPLNIHSSQIENTSYNQNEQEQNRQRLINSYPKANWIDEIDISDNNARVGIRMVSRDHYPVMGLMPNIEKLQKIYQANFKRGNKQANKNFWSHTPIPVYDGLYLLGGLGSRGICSGPLIAEALAQILCEQSPIINQPMLDNLNPNRYWLNKLLKGCEI